MATQKVDPRQPDSTDVEVGRLVRALRMSRGISQSELGDQVGVTFQQVQKYESGINRISMGRLSRIAKLFGVSVPYLLSGRNQAVGPQSSPKSAADYTEALEMLGLIGAQRLLKAFAAIPSKPTKLRESIVQVVECTAAGGRANQASPVKRRRNARR